MKKDFFFLCVFDSGGGKEKGKRRAEKEKEETAGFI